MPVAARRPQSSAPAVAAAFSVENLEGRQLLTATWARFPQLIHQDQLVADYPSITGAGVTVALIDHGVMADNPWIDHGAGIGPNNTVIYGYNFDANNTDVSDYDGHGTGVAGIIAQDAYDTYDGDVNYTVHEQGIAPGVKIVELKQSGSNSIKGALDWIIANHTQYNIQVVNLTDFVQGDFNPSVYTSELQTIHDLGIFITSPVGNSGANAPIILPAASPYVFGTGAINPDDTFYTQSQRGDGLDALAPGNRVIMAYYDSLNHTNEIVTYAEGTSWASAHMAGTAVLLKQVNPSLTPDQITSIIQSTGTLVADPAHAGVSYPRLNLLAAVEAALNTVNDSYGVNDTTGTATAMTFTGNRAQVTGVRLHSGDPDYFKVTLSATEATTFSLGTAGGEAVPAYDVLTSGGAVVASNPTGPLNLVAGTYYVRVNAPARPLANPYSVTVDTTTPLPQPGDHATTAKTVRGSDGTLYMAWFDGSANDLKFASRAPDGGWSAVTTVDAGQYAGQWVSIALDNNGRPGIAYYDGFNADLKYAHYNGTTWDVATVDSKKVVGQYPSLTYSAAGVPVIAYEYVTGADLRVASQNGDGTWAVAAVDTVGDVGRSPSIAYDAATNQWGIGYEDLTHGWEKFATLKRNAWVASVVDSTTKAAGGSISLAFDASHQPAMSYYDGYQADLKFARFDGSKWAVATVASKKSQGLFSNLGFTTAGDADVFYDNQYSGALSRATDPSTSTSVAGPWSLSTVTIGGVGLWASRGPGSAITLSWLAGGTIQILDL